MARGVAGTGASTGAGTVASERVEIVTVIAFDGLRDLHLPRDAVLSRIVGLVGYEVDASDHLAAIGPAPGRARPDVLLLGEDEQGDIDVLANDASGGVAALLVGPLHGYVEVLPDVGFRYTPGRDFAGSDVFTY